MLASPGRTMGVDFEQRIDYSRLRRERLERARAALDASSLGALLLFPAETLLVAGTRYFTAVELSAERVSSGGNGIGVV